MDPLLIKVTVLGEPKSGKSSLVQRCINATFSDDYTPTQSMEFLMKTLSVDERRVSLQCYDITGHVLNPEATGPAKAVRAWIEPPVLKRSCVMLAYDVADPSTLEKLADWADHVKKGWDADRGGSVCMVVACKCDLALKGGLDAGRAFAEKNGFLFMDTSAMTEYNVVEAFQRLAEASVGKMLEQSVQHEQK